MSEAPALPPNQRSISQSEINAWLTCRHRWRYRYDPAYGYESRIPDRAPQLGSMVHKAMELAMRGRYESQISGVTIDTDGYDTLARAGVDEYIADFLAKFALPDNGTKLLSEEIEALRVLGDLASELACRALDFFRPNEWEVLDLGPIGRPAVPLIEATLRTPLRPFRDGFEGTLDLVARERSSGRAWLIDYKTRSRWQAGDAEEVNLQAAAYQYLLGKHGVNTVGSITFEIQSSLPTLPKRNKDGSMNRSQIRCDWPTYRAELVHAGLRPRDYAEMEQKLFGVEFHRLSRSPREWEEVSAVWRDIIVPAAREIASRRHQVIRCFRTLGACQGCTYRLPCLEELRGRDVTYIWESQFRKAGVATEGDGMGVSVEGEMGLDGMADGEPVFAVGVP